VTVLFIDIDFSSEKPIYQQLYEQLIICIANGSLKGGNALPPVRSMAEEIGINLHTVNKTYNILKDDGYINIDRRKGAIVTALPITPKPEQKESIIKELEVLISKSYLYGINENDFKQLVNNIYLNCGGKENE
jgi:GntR family transcriptional regulator